MQDVIFFGLYVAPIAAVVLLAAIKWGRVGVDPTVSARVLSLETHPLARIPADLSA